MRLIDADALPRHTQLEAMGNGKYEDVEVVYANDIYNAPTIDAVPVRHAFWKSTGVDEWGQCSFCGVPDKKKGAVYCRHCGAMMDGGELSETNR